MVPWADCAREDPIPVISPTTHVERTECSADHKRSSWKIGRLPQLERLASLPPREVLLAQVMGAMNGVNQRLVSMLHTHLSSIVNVLDQRRRQLEERS